MGTKEEGGMAAEVLGDVWGNDVKAQLGVWGLFFPNSEGLLTEGGWGNEEEEKEKNDGGGGGGGGGGSGGVGGVRVGFDGVVTGIEISVVAEMGVEVGVGVRLRVGVGVEKRVGKMTRKKVVFEMVSFVDSCM